MKKIPIADMADGLVPGVQVRLPGECDLFCESYFEWQGSTLPAGFKTKEISGGIMACGPHPPVFQKMEYHEDFEKFIFLDGVALMPFGDVAGDTVVMDTLQIVRIQPGTEILVSPGKAHFFPVAEGGRALRIYIVCPAMPYIHVYAQTPFEGEA